MSDIPVIFLCAIHRDFGDLKSDGVIIDAPSGGFIDELAKNELSVGLYDLTAISNIPERLGLYRYEGIAKLKDHPHAEDYYEFKGKFIPILLPAVGWFEQEA